MFWHFNSNIIFSLFLSFSLFLFIYFLFITKWEFVTILIQFIKYIIKIHVINKIAL